MKNWCSLFPSPFSDWMLVHLTWLSAILFAFSFLLCLPTKTFSSLPALTPETMKSFMLRLMYFTTLKMLLASLKESQNNWGKLFDVGFSTTGSTRMKAFIDAKCKFVSKFHLSRRVKSIWLKLKDSVWTIFASSRVFSLLSFSLKPLCASTDIRFTLIIKGAKAGKAFLNFFMQVLNSIWESQS